MTIRYRVRPLKYYIEEDDTTYVNLALLVNTVNKTYQFTTQNVMYEELFYGLMNEV